MPQGYSPTGCGTFGSQCGKAATNTRMQWGLGSDGTGLNAKFTFSGCKARTWAGQRQPFDERYRCRRGVRIEGRDAAVPVGVVPGEYPA